METFFTKYLWIVLLATTAGAAAFFAAGTNRLLGTALVAPPAPLVIEKATERKVARADRGTAIRARNVFDSSALLPPEPEGDDEGSDAEGEEDLVATDESEFGEHVPLSDLAVTVTGTVVSSIPSSSNASIKNGAETGLYFEGETIKDGAVIVAIRRSAVYIRRNNKLERLALGADGRGKGRGSRTPAPRSSRSRRSSRGRGRAAKGASAIKDGVKKVASNKYEVDRGMLEEQLEDLNKLGSQARIIPHYKDGRSDGFKLVGIRPGSLYSHIGVRSGDVIQQVNGEAINSPSKALKLFEKLRSSSEISVDILRRGKKQTLSYSIK